MNATTLFLLLVIAAGTLVLLGVFAVAWRRGPSAGPITAAELDRRAVARDRDPVAVAARPTAPVEPPPSAGAAVATAEAPPEDPLLKRERVTEAEYGVTRRKFFNRALLAVWGLFLGQFALAGLAFMWPKLKGGFGTKINAGKLDDLKAQVLQGGTVVPLHNNPAQAWIVPFPLEKLPGSSFESVPFVIVGGEDDGIGIMAMWHRCVHLGCRVPSCIPSQGFECPCHGSKYNIHGEYEAGPAPRNLDRFGVTLNDAGELIIDTGTVVQTPRAKNKTAAYPQGPFCV